MPATTFEEEREYGAGRFATSELFRSDRMKVALGYFEPGQFIPVHAPASDVAVHVRSGRGLVRDGDASHRVGPGHTVVVEADTARGLRADPDTRLEALLVTAPPPTDREHAPVRRGLRDGTFDP